MKKAILTSLALTFAGLSLPVYANDTVHFDVVVNFPQRGYLLDPVLVTSTNLEYQRPPNNDSQKYRFTVTNQYGSADIPYSQRQKQTGPFNIVALYQLGTRLISCAGTWEHDFWKDNKGKHDRFYLTLASPCTVDPSNNPSDPEGGLHHKGDTYTVQGRYG